MNDESKTEDTAGGASSASSHSSFIVHHSSFHTIRLGPPWQVTATADGTRRARKFGRPRALDANERLFLVCAHVPGAAEVRVNGLLLGTLNESGPFAVDVTSLLEPRNEVVFVVRSEAALGAVGLEVRPV